MTPATTDEITLKIVENALTCARQTDKWRKPYAAIISPSGEREWISSRGRFRSLLEAEQQQEFCDLLEKISNLGPGWRVETRDARHCTHKIEHRDVRTRTAEGWTHEVIAAEKRGYRAAI